MSETKFHTRTKPIYSRDQINEDGMGGVCSTHGTDEKYRILGGKPERKTTWKT